MTRAYWTLILLLGLAWGSSYLFIKVGVDGGLDPALFMCVRLIIAGVILAGIRVLQIGIRRTVAELVRAARICIPIGVLSGSIPMWLVAWGETRIESSVAGIAQATVPIFTVALAVRFLPGERAGRARYAGLVVGLIGVAVLAGLDTSGGWRAALGLFAVVGSSVAYASSNVLAQRGIRDTPGLVLATGAMLAGGLALLPFALLQLPDRMPTVGAIFGLGALILIGTVFAQLIYYRALRSFGAQRTSFVAYLMPAVSLVLGVSFLDEPITAAALGGFVLIVAGVGLGSGTLRLPRLRSTPS